jgi:tetratricopeptide (TPR) repeat protein
MNQHMSEASAEKNADALTLHDVDAVKPWEDLSTILALGDQAREENDATKAFTFYARATELEPSSVRAWLGRAAATPNADDAIKSWAYALSLAPADDQAKSALGQRIEERIRQSRLEDAGDLLNVGRILAEAGQKDFSHRLLARATELDDTNEEAWIWRAGVAKDSKEIVSCLNQALALNPANAKAQAGLQWAMSVQADTVTPRDSQAVERAARLIDQAQQLLQNHDRVGAHELFQKASELDRTNEAAWLWRGSTTTDVDEALTCMEQALAINPQNESAREARSWLRVKKLRERPEASPHADTLQHSEAALAAPVKNSSSVSFLLLIIPVVLILLGLAVLIWKLFP